MTHASRRLVLAAAVLLLAAPARAQDRPIVSLVPDELARWDIAGHAGRLGSEKPDAGTEWDRWLSTATGGVSLGRYITPHVKAEVVISAAREGRLYGQEPVPLPHAPFVQFRPTEHYFQSTTAGGGLSYQLFENQWFHPFVGAGIDVVREQHRMERPPHVLPGRDPRAPFVPVPAARGETEVAYYARPFAATGFKWYVSERTFVRTDVRAAFASRAMRVAWTAGFGVDL